MKKMLFTECVDIVGSSCKQFDGQKNYISTGAVAVDHIDENKVEIVDYKTRPSRGDLVVEQGTLLFAKMQGTKKTLYIDKEKSDYIYSTGFCGLRAKSGVITTRCLYYLLGSKLFLSQKDNNCSGATQKAITNVGLGKIHISIPEYQLQESIANQLDRILLIIQLRQQQIKKLDELVKAQFVEMFGDINTNDRNWTCMPLGDLCTIVRGGSPRPIENFLGGNIPWIKIGDATVGDNIYLNSTNEHIVGEGVKKSRLVKSGSLIFANCGVSLGFARIITFDGCIHDGWLAMEDIDNRLDKIFLLQALNQMTQYFRKIAPAGTQPNLNTVIMKSYKQVVPPIELQQKYVSFIKHINKSKFAIQQALDKSQLLFDSLMQKYFG